RGWRDVLVVLVRVRAVFLCTYSRPSPPTAEPSRDDSPCSRYVWLWPPSRQSVHGLCARSPAQRRGICRHERGTQEIGHVASASRKSQISRAALAVLPWTFGGTARLE